MHNNGLRVFQGASAIITGGASGIGLALARELSRRGAHVALADVKFEQAEAAAAAIRATGATASAHALDVTDYEAVNRLVRQTVDEKGRLDYFFNNAGISRGGEVRLYELEDWYRVLDVNVRGVVHGIHAAYPLMIEQGFGHIVNTASITGLVGSPNLVSYSASKHAVVGMSKALRVEAEQYGVRVSVLCPGTIKTPFLDGGPFGQPIARLADEPAPAQLDGPEPMDADEFAVCALGAIAKNKAIIVLPSGWKTLWWLDRISPSWSFRLGRRILHAANEKGGGTQKAEASDVKG
jgi:NAD(P)-dependent dehydrogenase (short-subunit alcohol dehydrogenase family)